MKDLINIETGEFLNEDSDDTQLSDAYKAVMLKIKELEPIAENLKMAILDRLSEDQKQFGNYFNIRYINRKYINLDKLPKDVKHDYLKAKEMLKEYEDQFGDPKIITQIWFPKF